MKISLKRLIYNIIAFLICIMAILGVSEDYFPVYRTVKYVLIVVNGLYLLPKLPVLIKRKHLGMNLLLLMFFLVVLFVSYANISGLKMRNPFLAAIVFCAIQAEVFWFIEYSAEQRLIPDLINMSYIGTLLLVAINDTIVMLEPTFYNEYNGYVLGTKFSVSYMHLVLISLFLVNSELKRRGKIKTSFILGIYIILSFCITTTVNCNTGTIGVVLFLVFYCLFKFASKALRKPGVFIAALMVSLAFVIICELLLLNPWIQKIVTEVLDRTLTLTGRVHIYSSIGNVLQGHYWGGYGYGSSYEICLRYLGYADAQNGLLDWILQIGVPGTIFFVAICYRSFYATSKVKTFSKIFVPIMCFLYVLAILGMVEITLRGLFLFFIALLYGCASANLNLRGEEEYEG